MRKRGALVLFGGLATTVGVVLAQMSAPGSLGMDLSAGFLLDEDDPSSVTDEERRAQHATRAFQIVALNSTLSEDAVQSLLERSDAVTAAVDLDASGLAHLVASIPVTESEVRDWYDQNRGTFGTRDVEQSRQSIELIIKYEKALVLLEGHSSIRIPDAASLPIRKHD